MSAKFFSEIRAEIQAAVSLWKKEAEVHAPAFVIEPDLTIFSAGFYCDSHDVNLKARMPEVANGLPVTVAARDHRYPLSIAATLHQERTSSTLSAVCHEASLKSAHTTVRHVGFQNIRQKTVKSLQALPCKAQLQSIAIAQSLTSVHEIAPVRFKTTNASKTPKLPVTQSHAFPMRFFTLPQVRNPLPLHKFPSEIKERFRKALAEKAGVTPNRILLKTAYDRINTALYDNMQQDERGLLLCTPKLDVLARKRTRETTAVINSKPMSYLVLGIRLDTKEPVQTMVSIESGENA